MGGQERAVILQADRLRSRGHQIHVLFEPGSPIEELARSKGLSLESLKMDHLHYPQAIAAFRRILCRDRPDVLHMNSSRDSWIGCLAARLMAHRPGLVRTRHISTPLKKRATTQLLYRRLLDRVIVSGSEITRQGLIDRDGLQADRVAAFPIGVDVAEFCPGPPTSDLRKELQLASDHYLVGMISYLRSYKGHEYFVHAAEQVLAKHSNVTFLIVGEGPEEETLRSLVMQLGLERGVRLLGFRDDLLNVFRSLNLFVIPSVEGDTIPQVVMQAFAMGLPVVSTETGSIPDVVKNGETGFVVPSHNAELLAKRIGEIIQDPEGGRDMGRNGRRMVEEEFSLDRMMDRLEAVYRAVCRPSTFEA